MLIYWINRLKKITFVFNKLKKKTFLFLYCLNIIILFSKTNEIFYILIISLLICAIICFVILFFKFSMTFLLKCFIIKFKSQILNFSIIVDIVEADFETKLMIIDINARRFWLISFRDRFSKRTNSNWIMNLKFMISKMSKNSKTR